MGSYLLFIKWCWLFHPFYLSVTEIQFTKTHQVEVSCRIFYDDLEKTLEKEQHVPVDIVKPKDKQQMGKWLNAYIQQHFQISANGQRLPLQYVGYEVRDDAAWIYFEHTDADIIRKVEVQSDVLYAQHPEQINIIQVTVNDQQKSTKLSTPETLAKFDF